MSEYNTRQRAPQYPALYEDVVVLPPSPTPLEGEPAPQNIQAALIIVVSANFMVMTLAIGIMLFKGIDPLTTVLAGITYFTVTTPIYLAIVTGVATAIHGRNERETTERLRIEAYRELGAMSIQWRISVETTRQLELAGRRGATGGQRISPLNTYVAAIPDGEEAQAEGVRFAMSLYQTDGWPDAKKVHESGRLKGRMIGSKRGAGSRDAGRWLLREGIVKRVQGGYALNVASYPTRDSLRHLL